VRTTNQSPHDTPQHTCYNTLDLPSYPGLRGEELRSRLKEVFGLILLFDATKGIGFSRA
jgi:hypothetical protein